MSRNIKKEIKSQRDIQYLNKDFKSFRRDLTSYANIHFSDKIKDFSEAGLGGMFIDLAAYVGDVMSYYLDYQYNELNLETAIESTNIERLVRATGIKITGASPSYVNITFYISVPSIVSEGEYIPDVTYLPIIKSGTILQSLNGVEFTLLEDLDLGKKDLIGQLIANKKIENIDGNGNPTSFIVYQEGLTTSAKSYQETFVIENTFVPFREIELSRPDIVEILSVIDEENNNYYEVESLSEDTVFERFTNFDNDKELVNDSLKIIPAPRRYELETSPTTAKTKIRFGGGRSDSYEDDIIPNPSDHALPLYGERKTFSKTPINPNKFLESGTLGLSPQGTSITVRYRSGGGLSHNVRSGDVANIKKIITEFPSNGIISQIRSARGSIECYNEFPASGGTDRPTLEDYRFLALSHRGSQGRIVTKQDIIARVYTMPAKLGRVFRAGIVRNTGNVNSASISIISRDKDGYLTLSSNNLKKNISKYLNEFRLLTDSYDIVDSFVANFAIEVDIKVDKKYNRDSTKNKVIETLAEYFKIENFQIDQPISLSEVVSLIYNIEGVTEIINIEMIERSGIISGLSYTGLPYSINERVLDNEYYPPMGGIFELKFPLNDIKVSAR